MKKDVRYGSKVLSRSSIWIALRATNSEAFFGGQRNRGFVTHLRKACGAKVPVEQIGGRRGLGTCRGRGAGGFPPYCCRDSAFGTPPQVPHTPYRHRKVTGASRKAASEGAKSELFRYPIQCFEEFRASCTARTLLPLPKRLQNLCGVGKCPQFSRCRNAKSLGIARCFTLYCRDPSSIGG
jgi:hypothetical protein